MDILREENLIFQDFFFFFGEAGWRTEMELGKGCLLAGPQTVLSPSGTN